ncbi:MAG: acylphosphatase [Ignavibacteriae bacterium]|nr:acylphosphatase [Ignavibacteriota bacterium]
MDCSAKIVVKGLVQGVGFRYFVYSKAVKLGIHGYTRNLFNGDVEIEAEGTRGSIEELIKEVKVGPRASHVSDVVIGWNEPTDKFNQFSIR